MMRVGVTLRHGQVLIFAALLVLGSCNRTPEETPVIPPPTPPLSRPVIGYGVISSSYTHVLSEPSQGSVALGYLRRGAVAEVLERKSVAVRDLRESWILVNGAYRGWIKEEGVQIYAHAAQARTASESLSLGPEVR